MIPEFSGLFMDEVQKLAPIFCTLTNRLPGHGYREHFTQWSNCRILHCLEQKVIAETLRQWVSQC